MAVTDLYDLLGYGSIFHGPFIELWNGLVRKRDVDDPAVPVDEDRDGTRIKAALQEHRANRDVAKLYVALPHYDSVDPPDRRAGLPRGRGGPRTWSCR